MGEQVATTENLIRLLHKCRQNKDLCQAKKLHAFMRQHHLDTHPALGNHLVPALVDCGCLHDAHRLFDKLPLRTEHSCTSLILGHIHKGEPHHAFPLYRTMQDDHVPASKHTFLALLRACSQCRDADTGREIHAEIIRKGMEGDPLIGNTLVDMHGKCGALSDACQVFHRLPARCAVSWNALIAGFMEHGIGHEVLDCLEWMQREGLSPDVVTVVWSLKACGSVGAAERGRLLCAEIVRKGFEKELLVGTATVDMFAKCGLLVEAQKVFDHLPVRNVVSWTSLITGYADNGLGIEAIYCFEQLQLEGVFPNAETYACILKACSGIGAVGKGQQIHIEIMKRGLERECYVGNVIVDLYAKCDLIVEAQNAFDGLLVRDLVAWAALIAGYAKQGLDEEVLHCLKKSQLQGVSLDKVTFVHCLRACGAVGALEIGRDVHARVRKLGLESDPFVGNILIDMYGKCGSVAEGREVFDKVPSRDVVSWNAIIKVYGDNHEASMAVQCFEDMQEEGVKPDQVTFMCLLVACSHTSLILKGREYFKLMKELQVEPRLKHYTCLVDLLGRSGHVFEAEKVAEATGCLQSMSALLSACKIYGEVDLGLRCFEHLVRLNPEDAAAYLMMSDIYAIDGKWNDASTIDELRKHLGAKKITASSLIEVDKQLHEFIVGKHNTEMLTALEALNSRMRYVEYVPKLELFSRNMMIEKGATCGDAMDDCDLNLNSTVYHKSFKFCNHFENTIKLSINQN